MMDAHVAAPTALGMAVALTISTHSPLKSRLPDVAPYLSQFDVAAHNEASIYFAPFGAGDDFCR